MDHIESLESRTLFSSGLPASVFSEVLQLQGDVAAARADVLGRAPTIRADVAALNASFRGLPANKANNALIATLKKDEAHSLAALQADIVAVQRTGTAAVSKTIAAGIAVSLHPTSAAAQARLSAALNSLQTFASNAAAKFEADAQSSQATLGADLTALALANPTNAPLQTAVTQTGGDLTDLLTSASGHLPTIEADLQQLLTDFATL